MDPRDKSEITGIFCEKNFVLKNFLNAILGTTPTLGFYSQYFLHLKFPTLTKNFKNKGATVSAETRLENLAGLVEMGQCVI